MREPWVGSVARERGRGRGADSKGDIIAKEERSNSKAAREGGGATGFSLFGGGRCVWDMFWCTRVPCSGVCGNFGISDAV